MRRFLYHLLIIILLLSVNQSVEAQEAGVRKVTGVVIDTERSPVVGASILVKETKKGQQEIDIRPWIYSWEIVDDMIKMQVSAGSVHNLKPEMVLKAFAEHIGWDMPQFALLVTRREMYADQGTEEERKLISLEALGEEIG